MSAGRPPGSHIGFLYISLTHLVLNSHSHSHPPYRWKMNGTDMNLEPGSRHQLMGGNLVIMSPTKTQDAGVYQCLASNPVGTVVSKEAVLRFGCEIRGSQDVGCGEMGPGEGAQEGQVVAASSQAFLPANGVLATAPFPWRRNWGAAC